ncbi:MAG: hypothetical protein ABIK96_04715 [bacterium]
MNRSTYFFAALLAILSLIACDSDTLSSSSQGAARVCTFICGSLAMPVGFGAGI